MFDTDYLYTNASLSNSPSTSTLCRSKEAIKLRVQKIFLRNLSPFDGSGMRAAPGFVLSSFLHTVLCVSVIGTPVKYEQKISSRRLIFQRVENILSTTVWNNDLPIRACKIPQQDFQKDSDVVFSIIREYFYIHAHRYTYGAMAWKDGFPSESQSLVAIKRIEDNATTDNWLGRFSVRDNGPELTWKQRSDPA